MFDGIGDLDQAGTLAFIDARHRELLAAEVDRLVGIGHWADLHGCPDCAGGAALRVLAGDDEQPVAGRNGHPLSGQPGGEWARVLGGDGNPEVLEFCVAEIAAILGVSTGAMLAELADVQDLRFRHPRLWRRVLDREVRTFRAREIVHRTRHLSAEAARWVDEQTAQAAGSMSWRSFLDIVDAKIVAADTALAEQRAAAAEADRFLRLGRTGELGLKTLVAKLRAHDAVFIDAMVTELAHKLGALGDTDPLEARKATALGLLANPLRVIALLAAFDAAVAEGRIPAEKPAPEEPPVDEPDPADPEGSPLPHDTDHDQADTADTAGSSTGSVPLPNPILNPFQNPQRVLDWLAGLDWTHLLPQAHLHVHATRASLLDGDGVARGEETGPITCDQLRRFFGTDTAYLHVRPVLDLDDIAPQDAYEATGRLREAVRLVNPHDVFPYAGSTSRHLDRDHPIPYLHPDNGGPPGQTHLGNQAPLGRFHHRIKTHGRWRLRQPEIGVYLWRSPHGHYFQTDATGTHRLTPQAGQAYWDASNPANTPRTRTTAGAIGSTGPPPPPSPLERSFAELIAKHTPAS